MSKKIYIEQATEKIGDFIIASEVREATEVEISQAKAAYAKGLCSHNIVVDEDCWPYYVRSCAICGEGLGTV